MEGIEHRIVAFNLEQGGYKKIFGLEKGFLFLREKPTPIGGDAWTSEETSEKGELGYVSLNENKPFSQNTGPKALQKKIRIHRENHNAKVQAIKDIKAVRIRLHLLQNNK